MGDRVALLRRTFGEEVLCPHCGGKRGLISLVKTKATIQTLLNAMHFPTGGSPAGPPKVVNPLPPDSAEEEFERDGEGESTDWPEYPDGWGQYLTGEG